MLKLSKYIEALRLGAAVDAPTNRDLNLVTATDTKTVKINSRDYGTQTTGSDIGLQSKPNVTISGTQAVIGAQFSPRFASTIDGASVVGVQAQPLLKGTGTVLTGDFTGFEADLTDSQQSGNTIGGDIVGLRIYQNMASQTVTGEVVGLKMDTAGSTLAWTYVAKLPDDSVIAKSTGTTTTQSGWVKVKIGSSARYIPTYTTVS